MGELLLISIRCRRTPANQRKVCESGTEDSVHIAGHDSDLCSILAQLYLQSGDTQQSYATKSANKMTEKEAGIFTGQERP
jgi:hypothetical protein